MDNILPKAESYFETGFRKVWLDDEFRFGPAVFWFVLVQESTCLRTWMSSPRSAHLLQKPFTL